MTVEIGTLTLKNFLKAFQLDIKHINRVDSVVNWFLPDFSIKGKELLIFNPGYIESKISRLETMKYLVQ
jgi:hypothetical protein